MSKTQTQAVLEWMRMRGSITAIDAKDHLGIMRLAARIDDLKNGRGCEAHAVKKKMIKVYNRDGETCRVAQYTLAPRARYDETTGQQYLALA